MRNSLWFGLSRVIDDDGLCLYAVLRCKQVGGFGIHVQCVFLQWATPYACTSAELVNRGRSLVSYVSCAPAKRR